MDKDSKTIRIHQATQERLAKLANELGLSVTNLASSILETQITKIYEDGSVSLSIKRNSDDSASVHIK